MINKLICSILLSSLLVTQYSNQYTGSTLASVTIAGAIIKATHVEVVKKYKRSECPVCKGKGWYLSGDKIKEVPCGYCEPETKDQTNHSHIQPKTRIIYNK
jgi:hypothetical protein